MSEPKFAQGITWDLSVFYNSLSDPRINQDKKEIKELVNQFSEEYRGKISGCDKSEFLAQALQNYESIVNKGAVLSLFASLMHSKDTEDEKISHFYQSIKEFSNDINNRLLFFELEILEIPPKVYEKMITATSLENYRQYLNHTRVFQPYTLSEAEEIVISKKNQTGAGAFIRMYNKLNSALLFKFTEGEEIKELSYSEIATIMSQHPERETREKAAREINRVYSKQEKVLTYIMNNQLLDKKISDEMRSYEFPQQSTFLSEEISRETVTAMSQAIATKYSLVEKYYLQKRLLLKLDQLHEWDRYAPIYSESENSKISYSDCQEMILESFEKFHPRFAKIANEFFENNWIDAEITPNKQNGAFCSLGTPTTHPFILTNYNGTQNDVRTLAHELGHGIHAYLSRKQNILQFWPATSIAEIASIFAENIVFEEIYAQIGDPRQKINLLAKRLEEKFATIFRQNAFYLFETKLHQARREEGELPTARINELFQTELQAMFGTGLTLTDLHANWWLPVIHFFNYNFYVFSYSFGETLASALYSQYKHDGEEFLPRYLEVLEQGGAKTLSELTQMLSVDISDENFWLEGLSTIEEEIEGFIDLSKQVD